VKPFVKSNKNDFIDAEAIAEAVNDQLAACRPPSAGQIARGGGYLRLRHESGLLHRKIGYEVLMELDGIPDVCNRTRRDRPFWGHHGIMK
jgi:hypothetical protein